MLASGNQEAALTRLAPVANADRAFVRSSLSLFRGAVVKDLVVAALPAGRTGAAGPAAAPETHRRARLRDGRRGQLPGDVAAGGHGGVRLAPAPAACHRGSLPYGTALERIAITLLYVMITELVVAGLAFLLSVSTDSPLGAVGGAVGLVIVSNILDAVTALGSWREILPTHWQFAWLYVLGPVVLGRDDRGCRGVGFLCAGAVRAGVPPFPHQGHRVLTRLPAPAGHADAASAAAAAEPALSCPCAGAYALVGGVP